MNTFKLSNITLKQFRSFLLYYGCSIEQGNGSGHEKWVKEGLARPITLQSHIDPIPEFIIKNCLRNLGLQRKEFEIIFISLLKKSKEPNKDSI